MFTTAKELLELSIINQQNPLMTLSPYFLIFQLEVRLQWVSQGFLENNLRSST